MPQHNNTSKNNKIKEQTERKTSDYLKSIIIHDLNNQDTNNLLIYKTCSKTFMDSTSLVNKGCNISTIVIK